LDRANAEKESGRRSDQIKACLHLGSLNVPVFQARETHLMDVVLPLYGRIPLPKKNDEKRGFCLGSREQSSLMFLGP
jgi:hypothetical protein